MNNNKQSSKGSGVVTILILVGVLLYNLFAGQLKGEDMSIVIASTIFVAFITVIVIAVSMAKGKKGDGKKQSAVPLSRPFPQPTAVKAPHVPALRHKDEAEEVITCGHKSGKEKYLEQVEGFYKNGLIDREEYKTLRAKYEKLEIPEDYH